MNTVRYAANDQSLAKLVSGITSPLDKACVLLVLECGLRLGELASLNLGSIVEARHSGIESIPDSAASVMVVRRCGDHSSVHLPIGTPAFTAVKEYLALRNYKSSEEPLFASTSGTRLTMIRLAQRLTQWCVRLNLEPISYNALRKAFASRCVSAGMDLASFKDVMGYTSWTSAVSRFSAAETSGHPHPLTANDDAVSELVPQAAKTSVTAVGTGAQGDIHAGQ